MSDVEKPRCDTCDTATHGENSITCHFSAHATTWTWNNTKILDQPRVDPFWFCEHHPDFPAWREQERARRKGEQA